MTRIESPVLEALQEIAREEHVSLSSTIRRALEEYVSRCRAPRRLPSFLGIGRSGRKDIAERAEELLWTPPRRDRHHFALVRPKHCPRFDLLP